MEAPLEQMDQSIELKDEVKAFRWLEPGDVKHTYDKLMSIMEQHLLLEQQENNRASSILAYTMKSGQAMAGAGTNVCRSYPKGKCKLSHCKYEHPPPTPAPPTPTTQHAKTDHDTTGRLLLNP